MSKIPIPGLNGIMTIIETDPKPMTPHEELEHDLIWKRLDHNLTAIYQDKLTALGLPNTWVDAEKVYGSQTSRDFIDGKYDELKLEAQIDEVNNLLSIFERKIRG